MPPKVMIRPKLQRKLSEAGLPAFRSGRLPEAGHTAMGEGCGYPAALLRIQGEALHDGHDVVASAGIAWEPDSGLPNQFLNPIRSRVSCDPVRETQIPQEALGKSFLGRAHWNMSNGRRRDAGGRSPVGIIQHIAKGLDGKQLSDKSLIVGNGLPAGAGS